MGRILSGAGALLVVPVLALPAFGQTFAVPGPLAEKYRDQGAKPGTGRSGTASIEARALLSRDGTVDVEVTTGTFDPASTRGILEKVQLKLLASGGDVLRMDNYRTAPTASGHAMFPYAGIARDTAVQVQANVTAVDWTRTDVVTARTSVALRPDVAATRLQSPERAEIDAPVVIAGVMREMNGETGARATCRLFADEVEIGAVAGAWVDAGSSVSCEFRTRFAAAGMKRLAMRVTDVAPRDDDASNNEARGAIEIVVPATGFDALAAFAWDERIEERTQVQRTISGHGMGATTETTDTERRSIEQSYGAQATFRGDAPFEQGRVTLRHSLAGLALPMLSIPVAGLAANDAEAPGCRDAVLQSGESVLLCSGDGRTTLAAHRWGGEVTYRSVYRRQLEFGSPQVKEESWTRNTGTPIAEFAGRYAAELEYASDRGMRTGAIEVSLDQYQLLKETNAWDPPSCVQPGSRETVCTRSSLRHWRTGGRTQ